MSTFNGIDYAIFILLFLSVAIGVARGLVKEIISLLAWVAAFVISTLYAVKFATFFPGAAPQTPGANPIESVSMVAIIVSYLVLFIGTLICGSFVKFLANYAVEGSGLSVANRLFGALFGLARGCLIVLLAMFFLAFTALTTHSLWKDSKLVAVFNPGVKWLNHLAQPYLAEIQTKMKKTTKNLNEEDLSDVIKAKPAKASPAKPAPEAIAPASEPATAAPVKVPAAPSAPTAPAVTPAPAPTAPVPAAPAPQSAPAATATPQTTPQTK